MEILRITENKRDFMPLLLLADEQESVVDTYLYRGDLFTLADPDLRGVCVVTDEGDYFELQNLAVGTPFQRQGYGSALVKHIFKHYAGRGKRMVVGTGDCPPQLAFYESCGFLYTHTVKDYMLDHYDHPIFEDGVQLRDKVYFAKELDRGEGGVLCHMK